MGFLLFILYAVSAIMWLAIFAAVLYALCKVLWSIFAWGFSTLKRLHTPLHMPSPPDTRGYMLPDGRMRYIP